MPIPILPQFIFNVDESGFVDFVDMRDKLVIALIVLTNKRIEKQLLMTGYDKQNVFVVYQKNGFINLRSFTYWAEQIFKPELIRVREINKHGGEAILLLDGCTLHSSDSF